MTSTHVLQSTCVYVYMPMAGERNRGIPHETFCFSETTRYCAHSCQFDGGHTVSRVGLLSQHNARRRLDNNNADVRTCSRPRHACLAEPDFLPFFRECPAPRA